MTQQTKISKIIHIKKKKRQKTKQNKNKKQANVKLFRNNKYMIIKIKKIQTNQSVPVSFISVTRERQLLVQLLDIHLHA